MKTLTTLFEHLDCGLIWADAEFTIRYVNARAAEQTGLTVGEKVPMGPVRRAMDSAMRGHSALPVKLPSASGDGQTLTITTMPGLGKQDAIALVRGDQPSSALTAGGGLDALLTVIRADLLEPWNKLTLESQLARRTPGAGETILGLVNQIEEVGSTLQKLLDLAGVWSSSALVANDRVDMWDMVRTVWQAVEPLAASRNLKVRFARFPAEAELAAVYGSEPWLRRVLIECLESEIRSIPRGATIDIEYHQMGARGLIVFRDSGLFAPPRKQATAMDLLVRPVRVDAEGEKQLSARDLIGLRLCKYIVEQHGGQLREEHDGVQRNFLIDLPTGAPAQTSTPELDLLQAQQYAKDLAALVARRKQRQQAATAA
jgi:hypothetical protein